MRFGYVERLQPVRIASGSVGDDASYADLTVTADPARLLNGR